MTHRPEDGAGVAAVDLAGTDVLVTGSTSGIGRETALALGRLGATVYVHGRDRAAGEAVLDELRPTPGTAGGFFQADFAEFDAVRDLAADITAACDGDLDVLVNNAGGYFRETELTADGLEYTTAVNHLAPFLLTNELLPAIEAGDGGRIVTVSSDAHRNGEIDPDRLDRPDAGFSAYCRSKLANVLFTVALADRVDEGVTANCLHPGVIPGSGFVRNLPGPLRTVASALGGSWNPLVASVAEGAETSVYLAASPDVAGVTGRYFDDCERATPSATARDPDLAERLWERSAELTGITERAAADAASDTGVESDAADAETGDAESADAETGDDAEAA